ncbi:MAG TPA: HDOD domain-containing protein [Bryobacteraceae bacterium]|nr:HDOD domain-containing protein [Bryobacteraceae bacterium]
MPQPRLGESGDSKGEISFGKLPGLKSLPPFPAVAVKLLSIISDDDADFREVSRLIMADTALSSQVIRLANSALFGFSREVTSVLKALSLVGANRIRDMLVTVALKNYMAPGDSPVLRACWRHSLAAALWGEALAQWYVLDRPMLYTAAILHDLGRIAMFKLAPESYGRFLEKAAADGRNDFRDMEREMFTLDHCQVGGYLSKLWDFQYGLIDVIGHHHDPVTPDSPKVRVLVQAACTAASMDGFAAAGPPREWDSARLSGLLPQDPRGLQPPLQDMQQRVVQELNLIECSLL